MIIDRLPLKAHDNLRSFSMTQNFDYKKERENNKSFD